MENSIAKRCRRVGIALIVVGIVLGLIVFILGIIHAVSYSEYSPRLDVSTYYGRSVSSFDTGTFIALFFQTLLFTFLVVFCFCIAALFFRAIAEIINLLEKGKSK